MIIYGTIFLVCTDITTTEPQGTGRKRGCSAPKGADSEPGKCQLISAVHLQLINSHSYPHALRKIGESGEEATFPYMIM